MGNKNAEVSELIKSGNPLQLVRDGTISYLHLQAALRYKAAEVEDTIKNEIDLELPKQRHYWICGPPNSGKTTWRLKNIKEDHYEIPKNNDFKNYNGEHNLWIDEFKGQLRPTELNALCDGGQKLNYKGGSTMAAKNTYVHVFSNWDIDSCFKNGLEKDDALTTGLHARFQEYFLNENY